VAEDVRMVVVADLDGGVVGTVGGAVVPYSVRLLCMR